MTSIHTCFDSNTQFVRAFPDEITKTCKSFAVNNFKQEKNLIDTIKQNCRKIVREKTGKRPFTNVNIARV